MKRQHPKRTKLEYETIPKERKKTRTNNNIQYGPLLISTPVTIGVTYVTVIMSLSLSFCCDIFIFIALHSTPPFKLTCTPTIVVFASNNATISCETLPMLSGVPGGMIAGALQMIACEFRRVAAEIRDELPANMQRMELESAAGNPPERCDEYSVELLLSDVAVMVNSVEPE